MSSRREKALRANPTVPERRMWRLLHPFRIGGYHFRKQEQIGPFYVDFACHQARLVIEVDGDTHFNDAAVEADAFRDAFLRHEGYTVLRFTNAEVMQAGDGVYTTIGAVLAGRPEGQRARRPLPIPPHEGEGEEAAAPFDCIDPGRPPPGLPHEGGGEEAAAPPLPVASIETNL